MADVEELKKIGHSSGTDTGLDDAGELDYEPSEPSPGTMKAMVSDNEEGETMDSDQGKLQRSNYNNPEQEFSSKMIKSNPLLDRSRSRGSSEPEEGEVDDLEEGEVKDESDDDSSQPSKEMRGRLPSEEGEEKSEYSSDHEDNKRTVQNRDQEKRYDQKNQSNDDPMRQPKRIPITAPSANHPQADDPNICRFYGRGQCTWGSYCKFAHVGSDRPYSPPMESEKTVRRPPEPKIIPPPTSAPVPLMALKTDPPPMLAATMRSNSPPPESAWERGLRQARERIKKATEKKEVDPDFERKRLTMPLGPGQHGDDQVSSPVTAEHQAPNFRPAPRPLVDFARRDPPGDQLYNEAGDENRAGYERRRGPPPQSIAANRISRESADEGYYRAHESAPAKSRPRDVDEPYYGKERPREMSPTAARMSRPDHNRDDYAPPPATSRKPPDYASSQPPAAAGYYHRQHSGSDYGRPSTEFRSGDDREVQRNRMESDGPGYEFRKSPPAYYRDRDPERGDLAVRGQDAGRPYDRRYNVQPRGGLDGRIMEQRQHVPPNYHYYRTLQQQQQRQQRVQTRPDSVHEKPVSEHNADRGGRDRGIGRNVYNYHYYKNQKQQQATTAAGRPLPYERPSYSRQDRGQPRDPWRRSPSPGGRRGAGSRLSGTEHRPARTQSGDGDRSASSSPTDAARRRHRSGSSSISCSSATSHSSVDSVRGRTAIERERGRKPPSTPPRLGRPKSRSDVSSASSRGSSRRQSRLSGQRRSISPANSRNGRVDRNKGTSRDRSPLRAARGRGTSKDSNDVASRAVAKALRDRSLSPLDDRVPRRARSGSSGSSIASGGHRPPYERRQKSPSSPRNPRSAAIEQQPPTKPLSPPPPAPFLPTATDQVGGKVDKTRAKLMEEQQGAEARQPIKMTIMAKNKVRTIHEMSQDEEGVPPKQQPALSSDDSKPPEKAPISPSHSPSPGPSEESAPPPAKRAKTSSDTSGSGGENKISRREQLLRQLRAVESAIDAKRKKDKTKH